MLYVGLAVVLVAERRILGTASSDYFLATPPRKHWRSAETIGLQITNVYGTKLSRVRVPDEINHGSESNRHR